MAKSSKRRKRKKTSGLYLSGMVIHRIEDTMALVSSVEEFRGKLAAGLAKRYLPQLRPGETPPDYALGVDLAVRDVRAALNLLSEFDDRLAFARTDQVSRQKKRSKLVREVIYPQLIAVRGEIDLAFGRSQGAWFHGIRGRTRRSPPALQKQLRRALNRLADPEREMPKPKHPHAYVNRELWLGRLQPLYLELKALNERIDRGQAEVPALNLEKNAAMEAFDLSYRDALRWVKAAFTAAGLTGRLIQTLKPYYLRRRMAAQARKKREARAAATAARKQAVETAAPKPKDTDRVAVPVPIVEWLENNRRLVGG